MISPVQNLTVLLDASVWSAEPVKEPPKNVHAHDQIFQQHSQSLDKPTRTRRVTMYTGDGGQ
eukprot:SAG31_NODE_558_length_14153_cov_9.068094_17_plen_62_part_00